MPPAATLTTATVLAVIKKPLDDLYEAVKDKVKIGASLLANASKEKALANHLIKCTHVKTLWNSDKPTCLYGFYFPSRIQFIDEVIKPINSLRDLPAGMNYVVQGTAGQGKSIFLRFLCGQETRKSHSTSRIPLFIELRRISADKPLHFLISEAVERLGLTISDDLLAIYFESGKFVLLLDAFDEIDPTLAGGVLGDTDTLAIRYPATQIIISSRPDAGIQQSPNFRVVRLAPLQVQDHLPFLKRVCKDEQQANHLHKAINSSVVEIKNLLQTPLLMTLLVILYKSQHLVPDTVPKFYEQLFDTLFYRHDRGKPGFERKRFTSLDDTRIKALFEAFCFNARLRNLGIVDNAAFTDCIGTACATTGIDVAPTAFKNEVVKTACLMVEEGFDLSFIHKSVAEYHAAAFIRHSSEQVAESFYKAMSQAETWRSWSQELRFLSETDRYRYSKHFWIPALDQTRKDFGLDVPMTGKAQLLASAPAMEYIDTTLIRVRAVRDQPIRVLGHTARRRQVGFGDQRFIWWWLGNLVERLEDHYRRNPLKGLESDTQNPEATPEGFVRLSNLLKSSETGPLVVAAYENARLKFESSLQAALLEVKQEAQKIELMAKLLPPQSSLPL